MQKPLWGEGAAQAALQEVFSACSALAMQRGLSAHSEARGEAEMPPCHCLTELPPQDAGTSSAGGAGGAASLFAERRGSERRRTRIIGSATSSMMDTACKAHQEQEACHSLLEGWGIEGKEAIEEKPD